MMPTHFQSENFTTHHLSIHVFYTHLGSPEESWCFARSGTPHHGLQVLPARGAVAHFLVTWKARNVSMSLRFPVVLLQPSLQTDAFSFGFNTCERHPKTLEKFKQIFLIDMSLFCLTKIEYFPTELLQSVIYEIIILMNM